MRNGSTSTGSLCALCAVLIGYGVMAGCSDSSGPSDSQIKAVCEAVCTKQDQCGLLSFVNTSKSQCVDLCTADANSDDSTNSSTCKPTDAQVNACVTAINNSTCTQLQTEAFPQECDICPGGGDRDGGSGGFPDGGVSYDGYSFDLNISFDGTSHSCSDLSTCCDGISDPTTKSSCQAIANGGYQYACSASYGTFC